MDSVLGLRGDLASSLLAMLPLMVLQAAAATGMLGLALVITRSEGRPISQRPVVLGCLLGFVNFSIAWFVSEWMAGPMKPHLVIDILLISGMIGGAPAAFATGVLSLYARYFFSGPAGMASVFAEATLYFFAGIALHRMVGARVWEGLNWRLLAFAWAFRIVITYAGIGVGHLVGYPPTLPMADFITLRTLVLPMSLLILSTALVLAHADAQIDRSRELEARLARIDALTGLPNRRALTEKLRDCCGITGAGYEEGSAESRKVFTLLVVQVGRLREVQLRHGPQAGSLLWSRLSLPGVAARLMAPLQPYRPQIFQYSDFALAILLEGARLEQIEKSGSVERFLTGLTNEVAGVLPGLSFRCAVVDTRLSEGEGEVEVPYRNITLASNSLETGVAYFNGLLQQDSDLDEEIEAALDRWLAEQAVPLGYQPKVRLADGIVVGAEALLRMRDTSGRPVPPMRVIALLRRRSALPRFEWAVIQTAVRLLATEGRRPELKGLTLSLNLTPESLRCPGFGAGVVALLEQAGVPAASLRFELIEWSELVQLPQVQANIEILTRAGVTFALDDFGIGYSTLMLLTQLPVVEVKIDQSLIAALDSGRSRPVLNVIVAAARRYGAVIVAEGVELPETLPNLRSLGVGHAQGYLFAGALPESDFLSFVQSKFAAVESPPAALSPSAQVQA